MAKQEINLGTPPGGADGDTSRTAFSKAKSNFDELYARIEASIQTIEEAVNKVNELAESRDELRARIEALEAR